MTFQHSPKGWRSATVTIFAIWLSVTIVGSKADRLLDSKVWNENIRTASTWSIKAMLLSERQDPKAHKQQDYLRKRPLIASVPRSELLQSRGLASDSLERKFEEEEEDKSEEEIQKSGEMEENASEPSSEEDDVDDGQEDSSATEEQESDGDKEHEDGDGSTEAKTKEEDEILYSEVETVEESGETEVDSGDNGEDETPREKGEDPADDYEPQKEDAQGTQEEDAVEKQPESKEAEHDGHSASVPAEEANNTPRDHLISASLDDDSDMIKSSTRASKTKSEVLDESSKSSEYNQMRESEVVRIGGLGIFLAISAMIFTAWQMSDNPDGIYAAACRIIITIIGLMVGIVMSPCRGWMGVGGGPPRYSGHMRVSTMDYGYRDPSLELS